MLNRATNLHLSAEELGTRMHVGVCVKGRESVCVCVHPSRTSPSHFAPNVILTCSDSSQALPRSKKKENLI